MLCRIAAYSGTAVSFLLKILKNVEFNDERGRDCITCVMG